MGKVGRIGFGILIVLSMILIGLGNTRVGKTVQLSLTSFFSPLCGWPSFIFNEFKIRRENKFLTHKLAELSMLNQSLQSLQYENERLRNLLEFKSSSPYKLIPARVIGRDPDPISGTCIIDKGADDNIKEGLPVITTDGIYGKVIEVKESTALIETIFNFNFRVAGMDLKSGAQGIVKWSGKGSSLIAQLPINSDIKTGDEVVTSGMGVVFPKGLKIGKVKEVSVDETKLFYNALLEPACDYSRVEVVFIISETKEIEEDVISVTPMWKIYKKEEKEEGEFMPEFELPEPSIRTP